MISDEIVNEVVAAHVGGDDEALECFATQGVPVNMILFLASEGGGRIHDDAGLMERLSFYAH